jgi:hypothetical protein
MLESGTPSGEAPMEQVEMPFEPPSQGQPALVTEPGEDRDGALCLFPDRFGLPLRIDAQAKPKTKQAHQGADTFIIRLSGCPFCFHQGRLRSLELAETEKRGELRQQRESQRIIGLQEKTGAVEEGDPRVDVAKK